MTKPKAVYMTVGNQTGWFLFNWEHPKGGMLLAPTLASLIDSFIRFTI